MNGLLVAMAVANPVITALLTIVVFLEKDKVKKRTEDLEAALKQCNQELVKTIKQQSSELEKIALGLSEVNKGLGNHIDKASKVMEDATTKTVNALVEVKDEVKKIEIAQTEAAKSVKDLQETLKNAISL
jgi:methyl-accepting chemotaxis protein